MSNKYLQIALIATFQLFMLFLIKSSSFENAVLTGIAMIATNVLLVSIETKDKK